MSRSRVRLLAALSAAIGLVVGLGLVELGLRAAGERPFHRSGNPRNRPILAHDPVLGWRPKPGVWWFGPYDSDQHWASAHIWPDGSRATGPAPVTGRPEVMLVGCSLTMGWAVNDDETWAWRLQELEPQLRITNRGVVGYGTYHSLLTLEERLRAGDRPAAVIYSYYFGHDERNVASEEQLRGIAMYSLEGMARTPFCTKGPGGELVRHPPAVWPGWPLEERLALVALLERAYVQLGARQRTRDAFEITNLLVGEMAELCRRNGIAFAMVDLLGPGPKFKEAQREFTSTRGIPLLDCDSATAAELKDGTLHLVPGDGHPDAVVHAWWARCVADGMHRIGLLRPDGAVARGDTSNAGRSR